jgi:hypothetical protein
MHPSLPQIKIFSLRVARTSYEVPIRGGALSSCFNWEHWDDSLRTEDGETTTDGKIFFPAILFLLRNVEKFGIFFKSCNSSC